MKFEFEIIDQDLADRAILIEMRSLVEEQIAKLSEFSQNNLPNEINHFRGSIESLENRWLFWQRERILNKLSEVLNADRKRFGDRDWCDNYY